MKRVLIGTMTALALAAFAAPASAQDAKVEKGTKVFADQKCSMCHSIAGKGNAEGSARRRRLEAQGRGDPRSGSSIRRR